MIFRNLFSSGRKQNLTTKVTKEHEGKTTPESKDTLGRLIRFVFPFCSFVTFVVHGVWERRSNLPLARRLHLLRCQPVHRRGGGSPPSLGKSKIAPPGDVVLHPRPPALS